MNAESRWAAVAALGQSVWYDNVARPALAGGHLAQLVDRDGVTGGTSNPSIFAKAVLDSLSARQDLASRQRFHAPSRFLNPSGRQPQPDRWQCQHGLAAAHAS